MLPGKDHDTDEEDYRKENQDIVTPQWCRRRVRCREAHSRPAPSERWCARGLDPETNEGDIHSVPTTAPALLGQDGPRAAGSVVQSTRRDRSRTLSAMRATRVALVGPLVANASRYWVRKSRNSTSSRWRSVREGSARSRFTRSAASWPSTAGVGVDISAPSTVSWCDCEASPYQLGTRRC
jgi:hypothetical protein